MVLVTSSSLAMARVSSLPVWAWPARASRLEVVREAVLPLVSVLLELL